MQDDAYHNQKEHEKDHCPHNQHAKLPQAAIKCSLQWTRSKTFCYVPKFSSTACGYDLGYGYAAHYGCAQENHVAGVRRRGNPITIRFLFRWEGLTCQRRLLDIKVASGKQACIGRD